MEIPDYYESLQISPNAEADTIHRARDGHVLEYT